MNINKDFNSYLAENKNKKANIGVFSIGLSAYWPQFQGVKEKLLKHFAYFTGELISRANSNIIVFNDICDNYDKSLEAGNFFASKNLDMLICFFSTYSPSSHAITVIQKSGNPHVLLIGLQPVPGINYDADEATTAFIIETCNITSLPEITNAMIRMNHKPLDIITGVLYKDEKAWKRIIDWCDVADTAYKLKYDHIGLLGHVYEGMLDMNSDPTMFDAFFGMHVEHIEMDDLKKIIDNINDSEINEKIREIKGLFNLPDPVIDPITSKVEISDLRWPAIVSAGMDKLVLNFKLTGLAYYYMGLDENDNEKMHAGMIIGNSLLTSKGIAVSGEQDLKNCIAMLIMSRFGSGGSFSELISADYNENFVLVGHDGPHHLNIAEGKPVLRNLSILHGKRGYGPSVEYKLKTGHVTILGLTQTYEGKFKFIIAEGESIAGETPANGNTSTRVKFTKDIRNFIEKWSNEGPTHHFALGTGHVANKIIALAKYLKVEYELISL